MLCFIKIKFVIALTAVQLMKHRDVHAICLPLRPFMLEISVAELLVNDKFILNAA